MQRIEDAKSGFAGRVENLGHMGNTIVRFCNGLQAIPYLAAVGNEIVVRVNHQDASELLLVCHLCHGLSQIEACERPCTSC
jgi:hypothetical protein